MTRRHTHAALRSPSRTCGLVGRPRRSVLALVLLVALAAAACGDAGDEPAEADGEPATTTTSRVDSAFPSPEWPEVDPGEAGFDPASLDDAVAIAEATGSHCLAVTRHGELVGEWAFGDFGPDDSMAWFSMTKSLMAVLVGMAQTDGLLDIDDAASDYLESWQDTESEDVTIRNLLANDSGRAWSPAIDSDLVRAGDATAYAIGLGQDHEPGELWAYNQSAIQALEGILDAALAGTGRDPVGYAEERLIEPLGLSGDWATDSAGNLTGYIGYTGTCDDALRLGHLALNLGEWDGEQLVDADFMEQATRRPSQDLEQAYGLLWWRNTDGGWLDQDGVQQESGLAFPGEPIDSFSARGAGGQAAIVFPSDGVVIARLSPIVPDQEGDPLEEISDAVARAIIEP